MCETLTRQVLAVEGRLKLAATLEGYYSMRMHVLVRFGKWLDIVDKPVPEYPDLYCVSTSMHYYAMGVANAALGSLSDAEQNQKDFEASLTRIPDDRRGFNDMALNVVAIGQTMLAGELAYHKGHHEVAFDHLRQSVILDDNLEYSEPWAWMDPPRSCRTPHGTGALHRS